jgi:hypothetical protein
MGDATRSARSGVGLAKQQYVEPSSSTAGFFQEAPTLVNGFHEDTAVIRVLECMGHCL